MKLLKDRLNSFKYALHGLVDLFYSQVNAKIHLLAAIIVFFLGCFFSISTIEWCLIIVCIFSVMAAEAFNTAIEYLTDLVSPDFHPLAGKTKDVAAAAVLLTAFGAALVGIMIFLPKLKIYFGF